MNSRDIELLSAYLDGQLGPSDSARIESRLNSDPNMRAALDDLRQARSLLRKLPQRRAPRNFTLTRQMAGLKAPEPRAYPTLRLAAVLAALLFVVSFAVNGLAPMAAPHLTAAAPVPFAGGMGGGCDTCSLTEIAPQAAAPATEAPLQSSAQLAPTPTPEASLMLAPQPTASADQSQPTPESYAKNAAPTSAGGQPPRAQNEAPIPIIWQIILGVATVLLGLIALFLRWDSERRFRN